MTPPNFRNLVVRDIAAYLMTECDMSEPEACTHAGRLADFATRCGEAIRDGLTLPVNADHLLTLETVKTRKGRRKIHQCSCGWVSPYAKSTTVAQAAAAGQHPQAFCPTPKKRRYPTQRAAELALLEFWRDAPEWKKQIRRVYECPCGQWHTTSKPQDAKQVD